MPRQIPSAALVKLAQTTGLEPVNIIRVQWVKDGGYYYYSDRRVIEQPAFQGKLISLADLEAVLNIDKSGTSTTVKVELDDTDGSIKAIFDINDIHNRPVVIYQWFAEANFSINYMFPIFEGAVATPIEWSEGGRVLSFDVMTSLEDREVGFSVEDGDFTGVSDILLGKAWPLVFGTVLDMPTIQMDEMPTGTTKIPLSIPDYTILDHVGYIDCQAARTAGKAVCLSLRASELMVEYTQLGGNTEVIPSKKQVPLKVGDGDLSFINGEQVQRIYSQREIDAINKAKEKAAGELTQALQSVSQYAKQLYNRAVQIRCQAYQMMNSVNTRMVPQAQELRAVFARQRLYDTNVIPIINGHLFRQGAEIEIKINNARFEGSFEGDNFIVTSKTAPRDEKRDNNGKIINQVPVPPVTPGLTITSSDCEGGSGGAYSNEAYWACEEPWHFTICRDDQSKTPVDRKEPWFAQAGASVNVGDNYPIRYILSITPGVQVLWLSARHTDANSNLKILTPIPPQYYTISTLVLGTITATIATFQQPLSTIEDDDWENDVFATLQSSIGPNVVDILIWLIQTYTENSIDSVSFNYVRNKLLNYPANFAILDKKNIIETLREIAWQSRCAIWIADGVFYLKYLPEQGSSVDTITEDDIEVNTLKITTTPTEDLVTKFIATWQASYATNDKNKIILTYNINKYGIKERTFDFYIYNSVELVYKSAVFWLIRMANMWKKISCKCFLTKLVSETMDNVTVDLAHRSNAYVPVVGVVEKAAYDSNDYSINMDIWLPVRIGEMLPYDFAYPAGISSQLLFPTDKDIAGGFINDIPQAKGATGNLNTVQPKSGSSSAHGRTTQTAPSDEADSPEHNNIPPIITTTTGPAPYTDVTIVPATQAQRPPNNYSLPPVEVPQPKVGVISSVPLGVINNQVYPGTITDQIDGNIYSATIYPNGLENEGVDLEEVTLLQIDPASVLPSGTQGFILGQKEFEDDSQTRTIDKFYFTPTVYQGDSPLT